MIYTYFIIIYILYAIKFVNFNWKKKMFNLLQN